MCGYTLLIHFTLFQDSPASLTPGLWEMFPAISPPSCWLKVLPRLYLFHCGMFYRENIDVLPWRFKSLNLDDFFFFFQQLDALFWANGVTSGLIFLICKMGKKGTDTMHLPSSCKSPSKFRPRLSSTIRDLSTTAAQTRSFPSRTWQPIMISSPFSQTGFQLVLFQHCQYFLLLL